MLWNLTFWSEAVQRAIRTFAQSLLAVLGGSAFNVWNASWTNALGVALGAAFLSLLMSVDRSSGTDRKPEIVEEVAVFAAPAKPVVKDSSAVTVACGSDLR